MSSSRKRPPQRWAIAVERPFTKELRKLPREAREAVFVSMRTVLESRNPARAPGVMPVRGVEGLYRIHANSERAELRVFFAFESDSTSSSYESHLGTVSFIDIRRKDGTTYKFN